MTNQDLITNTILRAKCTLACWSDTALKKEGGGENITCAVLKMTLLVKWIDVLEDFLCQFYSSADSSTAFICLTEEEALLLVGKVKILIK